MRGSPASRHSPKALGGIIPAHAGLTTQRDLIKARARDHPRACGAHPERLRYVVLIVGSSPRMRGSQCWYRQQREGLGIIPAHAGLTLRLCAVTTLLRDHPRACGAHGDLNCGSNAGLGSSPRMRGSQFYTARDIKLQGIIPAHAGLTAPLQRSQAPCRDHPRACGAHR